MLFDVQEDSGSKITAYVVPDSGGTIPSVRIRHDGTEIMVLSANESIPALIKAGRHSTGLCGFAIDETLIPDLETFTNLEIVEAETDLLIYRRPLPDAIPDLNLFRLETHLLPLWRIDDALKRRFQYWCKGIDRFGRETSTQVFCLKNGNSSYVSGRLFYKNYAFYLSKGIKVITMVRDPYLELAERLILLKNIGTRAEEVLGARDTIIFSPVIETLMEYDQLDEAFCKRFFKKASDTVFIAMSNPLVRQLTSSTPDEMPNQASVAAALDVMSKFELIGMRSAGVEFQRGLCDMLGMPQNDIPVVEEFPYVKQLGALLRKTVAAEAFLEKDLEVFHLLASAFKSLDA